MVLDSAERTNLTLSAGAVAASLALAPPAFAIGIAVGALLETANFRILHAGARRFLVDGAGSGPWLAGFGFRFGLLAGAVALSLSLGAHPVGLVLGLSLIVPSTLVWAWRRRPPVAECAPGPAPDDPSWDAWNAWLAREREPADEAGE